MSTRTTGIIIGTVAVALIALAVYTVVTVTNLHSEVDDLEATASTLRKQTKILEQSSSGDSQSSLKEVAKRLKKVEECLPEIQTEINALDLEAVGSEYFISTNSQVSSYCSPVVYPTPDE
jgi:uncharacterized protein YoxC